MPSDILVELSHIEHTFTLPTGKMLPVLGDVNFTLRTGELVAMLGPSGCGKSTLVRIAAGLLRPTRGHAAYRGQPLAGPDPRVALVFQQFALYPWLTVSQNIEQALIPRGLDERARQQRAAEAISMIGLDGFEAAYPRELSGGMKQRVGMARALSVGPELLCMDEPFSQVDAFTAETLRNEVVNLWRDREKYPESILLVSHDIHEVALMASRILIMSAHPGRIKTIIDNPLPYPRDPRSPAYQALVDRLHDIITGLYLPEEEAAPELVEQPASSAEVLVEPQPVPAGELTEEPVPSGVGFTPVPLIVIRDIIGLLDAVHSRGGQMELFRLTAEMGRTFTRILLASKAAELLGFLTTPEDRLVLTDLGRQMSIAPRKIRKQLLRAQLMRVPLIKRLHTMLEHSPDHRLDRDVVLEELAIQCPQEDPKRLLRVLINWARFAELWAYDEAAHALAMNGHAPASPAASPPLAPSESADDGSTPGS